MVLLTKYQSGQKWQDRSDVNMRAKRILIFVAA